jgi:O-antigen ligase
LSSKRPERTPITPHLENPRRTPFREEGVRETDPSSGEKMGAERAKQLFNDLESELLDLDAGYHVVINEENVSRKHISTRKHQADAVILSSNEMGIQVLNKEQVLPLTAALSAGIPSSSKLSSVSRPGKTIVSGFVAAYDRVRIWLEQNRHRWLKPLIIMVVLEISIVLAYIGSVRRLEYTLVLLCGIGVILLFMYQPTLGLILTVVGGMLIPFSGPSGLNVAVLGIVLLTGLWFLDMFVRQRQIHLIHSRTMPPLIIFIIISILSFLVGQLPFFVYFQPAPIDAQLGGLAIFMFSAFAFIIVAHQVHDLGGLEIITWGIIIFGTIYIFGRSINWGGIDQIYQNGFVAGSMFWTWMAAMTFSQAAFNIKLKPIWRLALAGVLILLLYVAIIKQYDWKSGWMPPLAAIAAILIFRYRKIALAAMPVGALAGIFIVIRAIAGEQWSWSTRLEAWRIVLEISKSSPIFGLGFANYHFYTKLIPIMGWYSTFNSHNQYIDLIAQTGVLGLGCFLWLIGETGALGWRLRRQVPDGFATAYVYGALGGLVGVLVSAGLVDWVLPFVYNIGLTGFRASVLAWVFLGGLVSLEQIYGQDRTMTRMDINAGRSRG